MGTIPSLIVLAIGCISTAYCMERLARYLIWRFKGTRVDVDLDDDYVDRLDEIAGHTNLSREKVLEVIVVMEALKVIDKENTNV